MALDPNFPADPFAILDPALRWYPGDALLGRIGSEKLIPPLVERVRQGVCKWRQTGYAGASETTRALLSWWFERDHFTYGPEGPVLFRWYFAQREAVESAIWLYEVEGARDPYSLMRFDSSGAVSLGMFDEIWTRYVLKLATGAGKTKVASLLIAWSHFHKLYEPGSPLSTNALLIAPNIIVLDRLRVDFDGGRIFWDDPILPENGYEGRSWKNEFQLTVHVQDEIGHVAPSGNLFLTNIHRVGNDERKAPSWDLSEQFLGRKPVTRTTERQVDLGVIVRTVPDLLVINDEAHHVRRETDWFKQIEELDAGLRRKGSGLSAQFDLTATPRHTNRSIFVQTISDYPLVEAVAQGVVKTPVLPDQASRARLQARQSDDFVERYADHLDLGVREWKRTYEELERAGKKSVLFVMTDDTKNCDAVAAWLEARYPDLTGAVLTIHTNARGEVSEFGSGKAAKAELDTMRRESREIDSWDSRYKAVVSVMVLREGWDVRNVTTIVGLRAYAAPAAILPEQTLGRGLRRMFRGNDVKEIVSVVGTDAFLAFVEEIKNEGVELEQRPMGAGSNPAGPMVIEVDRGDPDKDVVALDIELPRLKPRIEREYKRLDELGSGDGALKPAGLPLRSFSPEEQREIVFRDINRDEISHVTRLDEGGVTDWRHVVGWFARTIMADLRLVGGFDVLFDKLQGYIQNGLFDLAVDLDDPNVLRNLSEVVVTRALFDTFKGAINRLTVHDSGTTAVQDRIKVSGSRPQVVRRRPTLAARKSLFNQVAGDNDFELAFAKFLDDASDVQAFFKNTEATGFRLEYQSAGGGIIRDYLPDFVVRTTDGAIWIVETKGREDVQDARKWERLRLWCADATAQDIPHRYAALFVRQEEWEALLNPLRTFGEAASVFK
ncbi:DEAD/DEAH box helicase family protein [Methylorubrum sp. POS3]|uniref:DEAD/DEAH box helicase family protein n=1 Tax=Methylorubrum sp. POS3 TaxID=2998492 RepID=UPI00372A5116